ncbi:hypothetical protein EJB05_33276 [Eragrostis curvula]|uniref:DNA (cytosine-5-)-methyltransferase n=1 Tax=Eragrostis curvula TaxID=38414 RepID=A0A5J9U1E6_9POAL|nr:hypothetical protein EJB05_33276 [Eragrostis curvula]
MSPDPKAAPAPPPPSPIAMLPDPVAAPAPPPPAEPRRGSRKRVKTAAAREAGINREEVSRDEPRKRKRHRSRAAAKETRDAEAKAPELYRADRELSRARPGRKRQSRAAKPKVDGSGPAGETIGAADDGDVCAEEPDLEEMAMEEEEEAAAALEAEEAKGGGDASAEKAGAKKRVAQPRTERSVDASEDHFVGDPVPDDEARKRWPDKYKAKGPDSLVKRSGEDEEIKARCHYRAAKVEDVIYELNDDVYVKAGPDEENYIGRITEFFEGIDHGSYFTCQWFFRAADTVISPKLLQVQDHKHDRKRVFLSEEKNDNMIECIISKIKIIHVDPNTTPEVKVKTTSDCDLYYDMSYSFAYSTFANLPADNDSVSSSAASNISSDDAIDSSKEKLASCFEASPIAHIETLSLLDLYSGCGAMSTGLCLGAALSGLNLETRWAVDMNTHACDSLKLNHPRSQVRNEKAENFLALLQEWDALCKKYVVPNSNTLASDASQSLSDDEDESLPEDTYEVEKLLDICYGDPNSMEKVGLWFKVRWKTYDPSFDTWEPIDNLRFFYHVLAIFFIFCCMQCFIIDTYCRDCPERIKEFVERGYRENILPLPGTVDVICGGPPCQGISGFNRFRARNEPLKDEKNKQMVVFMDIVGYLRPKYVLMENVVDILKFANGFLGRYALSRLVAMNYQARLGMMVAGCYGLPQFRMRVFLWGALPSMVLPKFPLPTHDVVKRGVVPNEFVQCVVAYDETEEPSLRKALFLADAISDLPEVENHQPKDALEYTLGPKTEFQRFIRLNRKAMKDYSFGEEVVPDEGKLFDHQPLRLNNDDYKRVQEIPFKKGANFRDLKGVRVGVNNTVEWDPSVPRVFLSSGKPLVPDYAMSFIKGKSTKPFGRLWWDETVPTVVTRAEPHNQVKIILHPSQARVLTIRENARLQGFPDYYRLLGPIKQKYMQVGNAVAVPVARALGYSLGMAYMGGLDGDTPLFKLPETFISVDQELVARTSTLVSGDDDVQLELVLD